jgi:hypothetical protein
LQALRQFGCPVGNCGGAALPTAAAVTAARRANVVIQRQKAGICVKLYPPVASGTGIA